MSEDSISIADVSDTSLWVAYYRAKETERPDALFRDPLAKVLIGERGEKIARHMKMIGRYTEWSVISRTVIIDEYIQGAIRDGIDMVINLGAGLDTRPHRMNLPSSLRWIEADYPHIIALKNERLKTEEPRCQLSRVEIDLADDVKRREFLSRVGAEAKKALVITEGLIIYLGPEQVSALAEELHAQPSFNYWITEYFHRDVYRYLKASLRTQKMKNAPFRFYPDDWLGFFAERGWVPQEIRYSGEEAIRHGREIPLPWWASMIMRFAPKAVLQRSKRMAGYVLFKKS